MTEKEIAALREKYVQPVLRKSDMMADPFEQFSKWFNAAVEAKCLEPNAMSFSSVGLDGHTSCRILLYKGLSPRNGFTFFSNYTSQKSREIEANPFASMLFCWLPMARQIRMQGRVVKLPHQESASYFASRPRGSQLGAWASNQSDEIASRDILERKMLEVKERFENDESIPMPPHWGGFELLPQKIEFWQGNDNRLHDRIVYEFEQDTWRIFRLAP